MISLFKPKLTIKVHLRDSDSTTTETLEVKELTAKRNVYVIRLDNYKEILVEVIK